MTTTAWAFLAAAAVTAVVDWWAVARGTRRVEYACKPATVALLIGVALALDPADGTQRWWFVAALALSLLGDVFLMLPHDAFVPGLAAFLLAHVAYIAGLRLEAGGIDPVALLVVVAVLPIARRVLAAAPRELLPPVAAYMAVVTAMGAYAVSTGDRRAAAGAILFIASDSVIAWDRFVQPVRYRSLVVMSTYHWAQALLVLSLLRR